MQVIEAPSEGRGLKRQQGLEGDVNVIRKRSMSTFRSAGQRTSLAFCSEVISVKTSPEGQAQCHLLRVLMAMLACIWISGIATAQTNPGLSMGISGSATGVVGQPIAISWSVQGPFVPECGGVFVGNWTASMGWSSDTGVNGSECVGFVAAGDPSPLPTAGVYQWTPTGPGTYQLQGVAQYCYGCSVFSNAILISVSPAAPVITSQPAPVTLCAGSDAVFSVGASSDDPLSYAWRKDGSILADGVTISGSEISNSGTQQLTITHTQDADAGEYACLITDTVTNAEVATNAATLFITGPGYNCDGTACYSLFAATVTRGVFPNTHFVAIGDFNLDGKPDLVTANPADNTVSVLLGDGTGAFMEPTAFQVIGDAGLNPCCGPVPVAVAVGDFSGDGIPDLATANSNSANVSILLGNGLGGFVSAFVCGTGAQAYSIAIGDFDRDGKPDLAVATISGVVSILLGNGNGDFHPAAIPTYTVGPSLRSVATGDFDSDGKLDLAVAVAGDDRLSILLGNGDGTFAQGSDIPVGSYPYFVSIGDFNGDSSPDLASANLLGKSVSVVLGNGDGTFYPATPVRDYSTDNHEVTSVVAGDLDVDGEQDLAMTYYGPNGAESRVSILPGNGDGTFQAPLNFAVGVVPNCVAVGDFNGDGRPDFATANRVNTVSVRLGRTPDPLIIFQQPLSRSTCSSGTAAFSVTTGGGAGSGPLAYQWQWQPAGAAGAWSNLTDGVVAGVGTVSGANTNDVSLPEVLVATAMAGGLALAIDLRCIVTNACGSATSDPATLTVCPADITCDGGVDINDLLTFLSAFESGSPVADLDDGTGNGMPDGGIDINDLLFFLAHFEAGC